MAGTRLESLDAFRGLTVASMILVNNPGSWSNIYAPLRHAEWHGCTPTDLIFPFFLFIVGVSIHFSFQDKLETGLTGSIFFKILKRTSIIFSLGLLLTLFPSFNFQSMRIPGVLQRISIVFLITTLVYFKLNWVSQIRLAAVMLFGYYVVMNFIPVPGVGDSNLDKGTNLAAWIDRVVLEGHMWSQTKTWDPEGILSTVPAIVTCLIGLWVGKILSNQQTQEQKTIVMFLIGAGLIIAGLGWATLFPLNKALWTSSFVLYTAGIACQGLAVMYYIIDVQKISAWAVPFRYYGMNAIFVFVVSGLLAKVLIRIKVGRENPISLWGWIYNTGFESWLPPQLASFCFAVSLVIFFGLILRWMYQKKIFIKV